MMRIPHPRFLLFLVLMFLVTLLTALNSELHDALVVGFDVAAIAFIASSLPIWRADHIDAIRARGARDDGGRVLILVVALIVMAAVLISLAGMINARGALRIVDLVLVAFTLVSAWVFANLVYAFHYAHLYYDQSGTGDVGGLMFPGGEAPLFSDFCYFALVIGMTCQVSDVVVETSQMRRVVLIHGMIAFFFNLGVLSLTVNVLSGVL